MAEDARASQAPAQGNPTPSKAQQTTTKRHPVACRPTITVGLNEAALDSPTFRAIAVHFGDQVDGIERWLEGYVKSTSKLVHDILALEETINSYISKTVPPPAVADGVLDSDFTLLALKRVGDGSREWWTQMLGSMRRIEMLGAEPIRAFVNGDLRSFKDVRRTLDMTQKTFDSTLARYVSQSKTKEPSALREDAFAVYETRKAYVKASMDFCQLAPHLRFTLDKLLVRVSADIWKEMKRSRDPDANATKWGEEMERLRGWARDLESSEMVLKRELQSARRELGQGTLDQYKPSRELDDYSASTVPFLGTRGPLNVMQKGQAAVISEKQGWLFLRTISGKPARLNWIRRWYYCRDGTFGWLVQGPQGVLQGDEIGVLLCSAKPAVQEERRFCFEIKTKSQTLLLQAETQTQLQEWLEVFEVAKKHAFDASIDGDVTLLPGGIDPAFAITPPSMPEFSARNLDSQLGLADEGAASLDRASTLALPGTGGAPGDAGLAHRSSFDPSGSLPRRSATALARDLAREEGESSREHAARLMQKLDLHRRGTSSEMQPATTGIAGLISASHNLLPGYAGYPANVVGAVTSSPGPPRPLVLPIIEQRPGSLAPSTFVKPPAATILSKAAVIASAERAVGAEAPGSLPTAIMANYWGTNPWGVVFAGQDPPVHQTVAVPKEVPSGQSSGVTSPTGSHRKTVSMGANMPVPAIREQSSAEKFPPKYPPELKSQHAQFRLLFPNVPLAEKLVLVFNASWSSAPLDETSTEPGLLGNGRVYVTPDNMYFYGHQMGLVVAYAISLDIITEVTAAPGKDCDFIYLHLGEQMNPTGFKRITIKTFLEELPLLHSRLNLLIDDLQAEEPMDVTEIIAAMSNLENEEFEKESPSAESWEEVSSFTPVDDGTAHGRAIGRGPMGRKPGRVVRKPAHKLQLPNYPVVYEPEDMQKLVVERHFDLSAKACFHVLFGDKSFIFPKLYFERQAKEIAQGPWELADHGNMKRIFKFKVDFSDMLGRKKALEITDEQSVDVFSDHITYVVTHVKTPWHLPHSQAFKLVTKVVITHLAKSKCKLAIYNKVAWSNAPTFSKSLVERQALDDAGGDAEDLADIATDQIRKLGPHSRTKRAIQVYGNIGQQTPQMVIFTPSEADAHRRPQIKPRTLTAMVLETLRSFMESVASSLMMWAFAGLKRVFHVVTANRLILIGLGLSIMGNVMMTGKETSGWWRERNAAKFMARLGVGPNTMMSKAVYLVDLEEATMGTSIGARPVPSKSVCYDSFQSIMNATDIDGPAEEAGLGLSSAASKAAARRLRRTRQKLGSYRHDLLVAMRVVNSVESELVQSEWENWLADENVRCQQAGIMLKEAKEREEGGIGKAKSKDKKKGKTLESPDGGRQKVMKPVDQERVTALKKWHDTYCGSCKADLAILENAAGRRSLLV